MYCILCNSNNENSFIYSSLYHFADSFICVYIFAFIIVNCIVAKYCILKNMFFDIIIFDYYNELKALYCSFYCWYKIKQCESVGWKFILDPCCSVVVSQQVHFLSLPPIAGLQACRTCNVHILMD